MAHVRVNASRTSASAVVDRIIETLGALPPTIGAPFGTE
jgi:hypothetical protein